MNLVFDIGGMSTKYALFDENDKLLKEGVSAYDHLVNDSEIKKIVVDIVEMIKSECEISNIALASPGCIDSKTGEISGLSAIFNYEKVNWKKELQVFVKENVFVENDANCAALAELYFNETLKIKNALVYVIGTGVGGAVILDSKLYKGSHSFAGEFGYQFVGTAADNTMTVSTCGSTRALMKCYESLANKNLDGKAIFRLYESEDANATAAVDKMVDVLSTSICNLFFAFDFDTVLIGGAISNNNLFVDALRTAFFKKLALQQVKLSVTVAKCKFTDKSNIYGALGLIKAAKQE